MSRCALHCQVDSPFKASPIARLPRGLEHMSTNRAFINQAQPSSCVIFVAKFDIPVQLQLALGQIFYPQISACLILPGIFEAFPRLDLIAMQSLANQSRAAFFLSSNVAQPPHLIATLASMLKHTCMHAIGGAATHTHACIFALLSPIGVVNY